MASPSVLCPSIEVLSAFGSGSLTPKGKETIQSHLNSCEACRTRFSQLSQSTIPATNLSNVAADVPHDSNTHNVPPELLKHQTYRIDRELGRGGMGVVYLGFDRLMERPVVIKVINKDLLKKPGATERFLREIRSAARLQHPNVMATYAAIQEGDLLAFAMEYVPGVDLAETVKGFATKGQRMPVANACHYIMQAAAGLQHVHEKGMVHRDIKPSNLVLVREGKKHTVKILDFGLAKTRGDKGAELVMVETRNDPGVTGAGKMLGTPDYMAPEQALDAANVDIRADVYSLGCSLYYLLTGGPAFRGKELVDVLKAHARETATPVHYVRTDVPAELSAVIAKAMSKKPEERFQTPAEFAKELLPFRSQTSTDTTPSRIEAPPQIPETPAPSHSETSPTAPNPFAQEVAPVDVSAAPAVSGPPSKKWLWGGIAAGVVTLGGAFAFMMIPAKPTPHVPIAFVIINGLPENAAVQIDGKIPKFKQEDGKEVIETTPGDHTLEITGAATAFMGPKKFSLTDGQRLSVDPRFERPRVPKADSARKEESPRPPTQPQTPTFGMNNQKGPPFGGGPTSPPAAPPTTGSLTQEPPGFGGGLGGMPQGGLGGRPQQPSKQNGPPKATKGKKRVVTKPGGKSPTQPAAKSPPPPSKPDPTPPVKTVKKSTSTKALAEAKVLVFGDPQPQLLRDKYPDLEFTEEKYHLVIPEFEEYENVLFLHPPSEAIPASIDFNATKDYKGTLILAFKNYPYPRSSKSRGTLIRVKARNKAQLKAVMDPVEIPIEDKWTFLKVPFDHQVIHIEQLALDWDCEGLFVHYEFEEEPGPGGAVK